VERSEAAAANADIVVMVVDAAAGWTEADGEIFSGLWGKGPGTRGCKVKGAALLVANKADLAGGAGGGWLGMGSGWGARPRGAVARCKLKALLDAPHPLQNAALITNHPTHPIQGGREVQLPLPVKEAFHAVVGTCAVTREGLGALEEAILQVGGGFGVNGGLPLQ
jgi:tRNA U34 5-carboxymethylaminomethyl modifying GTPase MnmE/TrmE